MINIDDFDSKEEFYFMHWLLELKEHGLAYEVAHVKKAFPFFAPQKTPWKEVLKTKIATREKATFTNLSYKPDFYIKFSPSAIGKLVYTPDTAITKEQKKECYCYTLHSDTLELFVDIKGSGFGITHSNGDSQYPIKRRLLWELHHKYVDKIIPYNSNLKSGGSRLFEKTFCPKIFLQDMTYQRNCSHGRKGQSKIKFNAKTIEQWLNQVPSQD